MSAQDKNEENIERLFTGFVDAESARQAAGEIEKGERILQRFRVDGPDEAVLTAVKAGVAEALERKKRRYAFRRKVSKIAAVAAVFIILAGTAFMLTDGDVSGIKTEGKSSLLSKDAWESYDITDEDADLAVLAAEIRQAEQRLITVRLGENDGNGGSKAEDLELELMKIDSEFWKG